MLNSILCYVKLILIEYSALNIDYQSNFASNDSEFKDCHESTESVDN